MPREPASSKAFSVRRRVSRLEVFSGQVIPLLALLLAAPAPLPAAGETAVPDASASVVRILEIDTSHHGGTQGTGFFISPSGLILTNAHVVHHAFTDRPVGRASSCSSDASGTPRKSCARRRRTRAGPGHDLPFTMDQAVLRIGPANTPFTRWYPLPGGYRYEYEPHDGPLPGFPALVTRTFRLPRTKISLLTSC